MNPLAPVYRWTPHKKLKLVRAIHSGEVSAEAAMAAHGLSREELVGWFDRVFRFGRAGLAVQSLQRVGR